MKTYAAKKKGLIIYLLVGFLALPVVFVFFNVALITTTPFILVPLIAPLLLVLWIYFDTYYKIENGVLYYHSGFLKGQVNISSMKEIAKGKTMWAGIKPALAAKGLIIKFNLSDKVYVAPENNDEMVADLLKENSQIKIIS